MLYLEDLNSLVCTNPDCHDPHADLEIKPRCHNAGIKVVYDQESCTLGVVCVECGNVAARVAVASEEAERAYFEDDDDDDLGDDEEDDYPFQPTPFPSYMMN